MRTFLIVYCAGIAVMSLIAFFLYFADKRKAQNGKWRIRESVLLGVGFLGGAVGALSGMKCFRHKTKHGYFWAVNLFSLALQIALPVFICICFF